MSNIKSSNQNYINQHKYKKRILEMKTSARGRQIIKPKRLLTSSDDKQKRRKRIIKCKSTNVLQEFKKDLQSCATQPNILRDITFASNTQKIKCLTLETPHKASQVVSCSELQDISSSCNNHNVNYNTNVLSKNFTGHRNSSVSCNNENSKLLNQNCKILQPCKSNGLKKNMSRSNDRTKVKMPTISKNSFVESLLNKENAQFINNVADISEVDNCQSISDYVYENTENNKHNTKNTPTILDINSVEIPIVFQESDCVGATTSNDTDQCEIIQLLRQVIEQNTEILSDIKVLKEHHTLTMRSNLYKRPDGFPLQTVEDFKELESDTDRLQELLTYLKFVGGIKLREALSHFQKETMTDELICKFTYWGRTKQSLAFYNTHIAKVFYHAAKMCPNFKGPETRAEFKLEMMEVFRAAKQRHYLKSKDRSTAATLETKETEACFVDTLSNDQFDIDPPGTPIDTPETEDPDMSDEETAGTAYDEVVDVNSNYGNYTYK